MKTERLHYLFEKYKAKMLTADEQREWFLFLNDQSVRHELESLLDEDWHKIDELTKSEMSDISAENIRSTVLHKTVKKKSYIWKYQVAAAAVLCFIAISVFYWKYNAAPGVEPGVNRAFLTLANGERVELNSDKDGIEWGDNGFHYTDGTEVAERGVIDAAEWVVLETPIGGQYKIKLADGTEVMLNAASSLSYPMHFGGMDSREVELKGEAFFAVTKNKDQPFIVKTSGQRVQVLGTKFMVSAYEDDAIEKTTLLEGEVEVATSKDAIRLKPNRQAIIKQGNLQERIVLANEEIAWIYDEFVFNNEVLEQIMKQLVRWYQVDVVYEDESLKTESFVGVVGRFENIDKLLEMLEATSGTVDFVRNGKSIIVKRK